MSIDKLHDRIRKTKNPLLMDLSVDKNGIPAHILEEEAGYCAAYTRFCRELMEELKELIAGVRVPFNAFALLGQQGVEALQSLLSYAKELGYYVVLDAPEIYSPWDAERIAQAIFAEDTYLCDGLIISPYIGTDAVKPFLPYCKEGKSLFLIVRSANKSAMDLQDLMTGSRLVHGAAAELVTRHGLAYLGKCGYSQIGGLVGAGVPASLQSIRRQHDRMFLLVDGIDYPSGNAKNCSYAFDRFGYGAVVCAGPGITAAWREEDACSDYLAAAKQAAERYRKNITRYVTVL